MVALRCRAIIRYLHESLKEFPQVSFTFSIHHVGLKKLSTIIKGIQLYLQKTISVKTISPVFFKLSNITKYGEILYQLC
jgi:hypothetical protein